jgi:hypothetical protein
MITGSESPPYCLGSLSLFAGDVPIASAAAPTTAPAVVPVTTSPAVAAAARPAVTINSQTLGDYLNRNGPAHIVLGTLGVILFTGVINSMWAILMMLLICPLVLLGAAGPKIGEGPDRRLILPRRAAYRMSAAVLVPLIVFGGALHAMGKPVVALLGFEAATLFWFFSAAALALWTGFLAKRLYAPTQAPRRAT